MFVLNPGAAGKDGGGSGDPASPLQQNIYFFGQLSVYFVLVRSAYFFFSSREQQGGATVASQ
jgi:hypothetical protein